MTLAGDTSALSHKGGAPRSADTLITPPAETKGVADMAGGESHGELRSLHGCWRCYRSLIGNKEVFENEQFARGQ
jgi:hypothetical protein